MTILPNKHVYFNVVHFAINTFVVLLKLNLECSAYGYARDVTVRGSHSGYTHWVVAGLNGAKNTSKMGKRFNKKSDISFYRPSLSV